METHKMKGQYSIEILSESRIIHVLHDNEFHFK